MTLLSATQIGLSYGDLDVFSGVNAQVEDRAHIGIVGPNGGGKTSLLRVLIGEMEPDRGTVAGLDGLRIGYVPQSPANSTAGTLGDEVMTAFAQLVELEEALASSALEIERAAAPSRRQADRRYSALLQQYEALGGYDYQSRMERVVSGVGLPLETLETPVTSASGGERTRAALARALLADPDLLILDEPTNYLDFQGLRWLETFLGRFSHAFIVVSHDRYFLDQVVTRVWELDRGRLQSFRGNYTSYRSLKRAQEERQRREFQSQQEYIAKEESFIQRYRAGQRAREARGRATRLGRLERIESPPAEASIHIGSAGASRTGQVVLSTHDLEVGFDGGGTRTPLLSVPDLRLERGSRTGIIGSNGVGKTTLLETILGLQPAIAGATSLGHGVKVGYLPQGSHALPEESSVLDALLETRNVPLSDARDYLAGFLFQRDDVFQLVNSLSGGERTRLALACLLITEPNVLVLDEPTTHLDIPSRESLEQALLGYEGAILFVSHDRHLISLLARQLWRIEDGVVHPFPGTLEEWWRQDGDGRHEPAVSARSSRKRRRASGPATAARSKSPPKPAGPNSEEVIHELELELARLERELADASESQDVKEIARLGPEYEETRLRLERAVEAWSD